MDKANVNLYLSDVVIRRSGRDRSGLFEFGSRSEFLRMNKRRSFEKAKRSREMMKMRFRTEKRSFCGHGEKRMKLSEDEFCGFWHEKIVGSNMI